MKNIADLYKLSPVQQDLLIDDRVGQVVYALRGRLDRSRLQRACKQTLARHGVLRTAFYWKNLEKPVQALQQNATLSIAEPDPEDVDAFIEADRRRTFDLSHAPLLRLS